MQKPSTRTQMHPAAQRLLFSFFFFSSSFSFVKGRKKKTGKTAEREDNKDTRKMRVMRLHKSGCFVRMSPSSSFFASLSSQSEKNPETESSCSFFFFFEGQTLIPYVSVREKRAPSPEKKKAWCF